MGIPITKMSISDKIWFICQEVRLGNLSESEATLEIQIAYKEAGYVKLADVQNIGAAISYLLGLHGQMKLYDNYPNNFNEIMGNIEVDLLKVVDGKAWRKIELEVGK